MALNGEPLDPVQPVGRLNRALPVVGISQVRRVGAGDQVEVTVEVSPGTVAVRRDGKDLVQTSAAYDLRLFRDGQLVDQWPVADERDEGEASSTARDDREWRCSHRIDGVPAGGKASRTFTVRLPHSKEAKALEISAYAFNESRVKSVTTRHVCQLLGDKVRPKRRAYLITMGINAFEDPNWDLNFAVSDARRIQESLGDRLRERKFEVVPICLISDRATLHPGEAPATRENLRAVLAALSRTNKPNEELGRRIPGADRLAPATPDDLVFLFTSTHGYTKPGSGVYYLFPHDIGPPPPGGRPLDVSDRLLARCIRSGELSAWLRAIDAGQLALVVDACHAAATVEQPGFKPGPMGSRGLGQLAYDKGMYVLAASAADDVALELDAVRHGLLTYALVREGLEQREERRHRIALERTWFTLGDWFSYAEQRVPSLYQEIREGKVKDVDGIPVRGVDVVVGSKGKPVRFADAGDLLANNTLRKPRVFQHPVLFNFSKKPDDVILDETFIAEGGRPSARRISLDVWQFAWVFCERAFGSLQNKNLLNSIYEQ
ncbi:MAG: caspase family protein [Actinomycetota bacterium]|nr:caspase family protein [Actinomycetota bacterium]